MIGKKENIEIGQRFNKLEVIEELPSHITKSGFYRRRFKCKCDCGTQKTFFLYNIKKGTTISCGCEHKKIISNLFSTHNMSKTEEYKIWKKMKDRCFNPKSRFFYRYGGRGITIHSEWQNDFMSFYQHIGKRPSKNHSIDRIDNNGNYEPGNVKWSTPKEQANNRR